MIYGNYLRDKYNNTAVKLADAEGVPCIMEYSKGKNMRNYEIYGNSVQEGTPSPDTPIEIQSVGDLVIDEASEHYGKYKIPIVCRSKNLIPYPYYHSTKTEGGITYTDNGDGSITVSGTATGYSSFYFIYKGELLSPNTQYCFSGLNNSTNMVLVINLYAEDGSAVAGLTSTSNLVFNTADYPTAVKITLSVKRNNNNVDTSGTLKPQLELGSTATDYEPYIEPTTTNIYLDEPLRKVGEYADYIDFKNQKVIRKVKHREFSSNNNWSVYLSAANHFQIIVGDNYFAQVEGVKVMSNYYPQYSGRYYSITSLDYAVLSADGSRLRFRDIRYTTLDEWKAFLDTLETPLAVNYILATPTEENISLPALKTFKGTSIMTVDTIIQPSNIKTKYVRL